MTLQRTTKPPQMSARRRAEFAALGIDNPRSSFLPKAKTPKLAAPRSLKLPARPAAPVSTGPDQAMVDLVLEVHQYSCVMCGYGLGDRRSIDYSIHHRVLRSHGVDNSFPNLVPLCGSGTTGDHGAVHAKPKWARLTGGWILRSTDNPATFPVLVERGARWVLLTFDGRAVTCRAPQDGELAA